MFFSDLDGYIQTCLKTLYGLSLLHPNRCNVAGDLACFSFQVFLSKTPFKRYAIPYILTVLSAILLSDVTWTASCSIITDYYEMESNQITESKKRSLSYVAA